MNKENYPSVQELKTLQVGLPFKTFVLIRKINRKVSKNNTTFLQIEVGDAKDSFTFNCFEGSAPYLFFSKPLSRCPQVVEIKGQAELFMEKFSPKVQSVLEVSDALYESLVGELSERPDELVEDLKEELEQLIQQIQYEKLAATVRQTLQDLGTGFFESVAAVSMHHAYVHGLLEHSVHVARVVQKLLPLYAEVNADLALAGALLHDVGKVLEYRYSANEGIDRTCVGRLQGHVVLGYRLVRSAALRQKLHPVWLERLEHIILSHQGEPEWGAAVYPATPEAVLVSLADNLDARMAMVHQQLKKAPNEQVFSDFIAGLQSRLLTQNVPDPTVDQMGF